MTTIVYNHKKRQIGVDGQLTGDGVIKTSTDIKYKEVGDSMWFFTGRNSEFEDFDKIYRGEVDFRSLIGNSFQVIGGVVYMHGTTDTEVWSSKVDFNEGLGSGGDLALAAIDLGKTTRMAVKFACERDIYSGGVISVYDIKKGEFL